MEQWKHSNYEKTWDCTCSSINNLSAPQCLDVTCALSVIQVCHAVNGVRLTSCKGAEDRTAMSVTHEQCMLLRECHMLSQQHFNVALDCMRRFWFLLLSFLSFSPPPPPLPHAFSSCKFVLENFCLDFPLASVLYSTFTLGLVFPGDR